MTYGYHNTRNQCDWDIQSEFIVGSNYSEKIEDNLGQSTFILSDPCTNQQLKVNKENKLADKVVIERLKVFMQLD